MIQAAKRYYDLNMTIGELSEELGLTRWQARRLLNDAREFGIVRIEIVPRTARSPDLESCLQRRFGLREAVVVREQMDDDEALALDGVAQAASQFIASLGPLPLIGVSWGRTMSAVARRLPPLWNDGVEVVLLNGAMNIRSPSARTNNTAELFARSANGAATLLPVPAILGRAATRVALEQDPTIASILALGRRAPAICFGMGAMASDSVLVQSGFITTEEQAALKAKGAVGDILAIHRRFRAGRRCGSRRKDNRTGPALLRRARVLDRRRGRSEQAPSGASLYPRALCQRACHRRGDCAFPSGREWRPNARRMRSRR